MLDQYLEMNKFQRITIALRDITEFHAAYPAWRKAVTAELPRKPVRYERLGKFQEKREKMIRPAVNRARREKG
ncbi:MAG: hypothetical protein ACKN9W_07140 [Methylococcus sp.]